MCPLCTFCCLTVTLDCLNSCTKSWLTVSFIIKFVQGVIEKISKDFEDFQRISFKTGVNGHEMTLSCTCVSASSSQLETNQQRCTK